MTSNSHSTRSNEFNDIKNVENGAHTQKLEPKYEIYERTSDPRWTPTPGYIYTSQTLKFCKP